MDGLLIVDKPAGMTSADVVRVAKRSLRSKTGHLGTLDPFATGVLPLCLGVATRIAQFLNTADKAYSGTIRLGVRTDTGDHTGRVTETASVPSIEPVRLRSVARSLTGEILQTPPMYSAVKVEGTPLYKLARRGVAVDRAPRRVRVSAFDLVPGALVDRLDFAIECSKGTYVRVIAEDVAKALGSVGHLTALRRTRFGPFGLEGAASLAEVEAGRVRCLGLREALHGLREFRLEAEPARRARHGYAPVLGLLGAGTPAEVAVLVDPAGELAAVIIAGSDGRWTFGRVFPPPGAQP